MILFLGLIYQVESRFIQSTSQLEKMNRKSFILSEGYENAKGKLQKNVKNFNE